jgi:hypothetical protein
MTLKVNDFGVVVSDPTSTNEYRLNDREYYRVEYHRLDNERWAFRYEGHLKNEGFSSPASIKDTYPSFKDAKEKALSIAMGGFSRAHLLLELIEHESRQLDLFGEVV